LPLIRPAFSLLEQLLEGLRWRTSDLPDFSKPSSLEDNFLRGHAPVVHLSGRRGQQRCSLQMQDEAQEQRLLL